MPPVLTQRAPTALPASSRSTTAVTPGRPLKAPLQWVISDEQRRVSFGERLSFSTRVGAGAGKDRVPKDHLEPKNATTQAIALVRSTVVGALTRRDLDRGEFRAELRTLAEQTWPPPRAEATRRFSVRSVGALVLRYRMPDLAALRARQRSDRSRASDAT